MRLFAVDRMDNKNVRILVDVVLLKCDGCFWNLSPFIIKIGLLPFPGALHKKRNIKKTCTSGTQNNLCKTTQECLRGKFIFSCELGFHVNANTDNFEKCAIFYFLSSRCSTTGLKWLQNPKNVLRTSPLDVLLHILLQFSKDWHIQISQKHLISHNT